MRQSPPQKLTKPNPFTSLKLGPLPECLMHTRLSYTAVSELYFKNQKESITPLSRRIALDYIDTYCRIRPDRLGSRAAFYNENNDTVGVQIDNKAYVYSFFKVFDEKSDANIPISIANRIMIEVKSENKDVILFPFGGMNTGKTHSIIGTRDNPGILRAFLKLIRGEISMHAIEIMANLPYNLGGDKQRLDEEEDPFKKEYLMKFESKDMNDEIDKLVARRNCSWETSSSHAVFRVYYRNHTITIIDIAAFVLKDGSDCPPEKLSEQKKIIDGFYDTISTNPPSYLVRLIHHYLSEQTKVMLLVNISPLTQHGEETKEVLEMARQMKRFDTNENYWREVKVEPVNPVEPTESKMKPEQEKCSQSSQSSSDSDSDGFWKPPKGREYTSVYADPDYGKKPHKTIEIRLRTCHPTLERMKMEENDEDLQYVGNFQYPQSFVQPTPEQKEEEIRLSKAIQKEKKEMKERIRKIMEESYEEKSQQPEEAQEDPEVPGNADKIAFLETKDDRQRSELKKGKVDLDETKIHQESQVKNLRSLSPRKNPRNNRQSKSMNSPRKSSPPKSIDNPQQCLISSLANLFLNEQEQCEPSKKLGGKKKVTKKLKPQMQSIIEESTDAKEQSETLHEIVSKRKIEKHTSKSPSRSPSCSPDFGQNIRNNLIQNGSISSKNKNERSKEEGSRESRKSRDKSQRREKVSKAEKRRKGRSKDSY